MYIYGRNPNLPADVEDLLKSHNEAKRNKMVKWEPFNTNKNYLQIGRFLIHASIKEQDG
jgi:hypothetical protein